MRRIRVADGGNEPRRWAWRWAVPGALLAFSVLIGLVLARSRQPLAFLNGYPLFRMYSMLSADRSTFIVVYRFDDDDDAMLRRLAFDAPKSGLSATSPYSYASSDGRTTLFAVGGTMTVTRPAHFWDRLSLWVLINPRGRVYKTFVPA